MSRESQSSNPLDKLIHRPTFSSFDEFKKQFSDAGKTRRADYIDAFWNIVNWEEVARRYETAVTSLNIK